MRKIYLLTLISLLSVSYLSAQSIQINGGGLTLAEAERILQRRNINLRTLELEGNNIILGEVSGAGKLVPFSRINIMMTKDEAILNREILRANFKGKKILDKLDSIEIQGKVIFKNEIKGLVYK